MTSSPPVIAPPVARERQDGATRQRLLLAALRLFAQRGFASTSTRDIAEAAQANVAAISYHFGDKAGLYHAAFFEPFGDPAAEVARFSEPTLTLDQALRAFLSGFIEPLRQGDAARDCVRLHFREMVDPSGLWEEELELSIRPSHEALVAVLQRHLGAAEPDDDIRALACSIAGLGVHLHVGRDIADCLAPGLQQGPQALDRWADRLLAYALAMVQVERQRRADDVLQSKA